MCQKYVCSIVPPEILSKLSKMGSVAAKDALADLKRIHLKREHCLSEVMIRAIAEENAERKVYDSENTTELRRKLVRAEKDAKTNDPDVDCMFDYAGFYREYLKSTFEYNSLDNKGMNLYLNVHYGKNYNNAFWDGDEMAFGDGDGKFLKNFAQSIDVVAHELTHGLTQFLANLRYFGQSGALNEHFSDVFGTIIKQKILNQTVDEADWLIGNDVVGEDFPGVALRSMKAPGTASDFDTQPDHMDNYYTGNDDNQGVHINSGIPNKAFYLASIELGIDATSLIWFETLKQLWATANFQDMLDVILQVTEELTIKERIPNSALNIIEQSFANIGLKTIKDEV